MLHRNAGHVLRLVPFAALFFASCAPARPEPILLPPPPAPGETPAEIDIPPSNSFGNLVRIRAQLLLYAKGDEHTRTRRGDCPDCLVNVEIESVGLTRDIVPRVGPRRERIIALITNTDPTHTESMYSLKPQTEYLMWVGPAPFNRDSTSRTRWGLIELPKGVTGVTRVDTIGYVVRCPQRHLQPSTRSDADFKSCEDSHVAPGVAHAATISRASFFGEPTVPDPVGRYVVGRTWFDCGGYCCSGTSVKN